jgi:hypothetical protein
LYILIYKHHLLFLVLLTLKKACFAMKKNILLHWTAIFILFLFSCKPNTTGSNEVIAAELAHPDWILQGNVYEVNVRQYTPEGTFTAFEKSLDRLKEMGVQTVWFMPINPISKKDRKGSLGSYYAVSDYTAVNPEFGTMDDFKKLVQSIHERGMKVLIDWVPNHTGADHRWLTEQPDFFEKDSSGNAAIAKDWADTRQLNYKNPVMEDSMINAMKFWISNADIDGFRCDVAWNVPATFWSKAIPQIRMMKDVFMLAEGDSAYLPFSGFDAVYPWHIFSTMVKVAKGEKNALALDSVKMESDSMYPKNTIQLYFTSNHDENTWNRSDFGTFPGPVHAPFAVFSQTMANSVPLVYSGQEEPLLRSLKFFDKDPIGFGKYERAGFYKTLQDLRTRNKALAADASFTKIHAGDDMSVYSFIRENDNKKVLVILNLSNKDQKITLQDSTLYGNPLNVFTGQKQTLNSETRTMAAWGYEVFEYAP